MPPHYTKEDWKRRWKALARGFRAKGIDGKEYIGTNWVFGGQVRVFCMPDVKESCAYPVIEGIEDMINEVGLNFNVNYYGRDESAIEEINESLNNRGRIDTRTLGKIVVAEKWRNPEYGGSPHADVFMSGKYCHPNDGDWGSSSFHKGLTVLSLPGIRQDSYQFLKNLSKHETGHLLGYETHHNHFTVEGYPEVDDCNMLYRCSTDYTCPKCLDAMKIFWQKFEERQREKFFR